MKNEIKAVYKELKERKIHPSGSFDKAGRWYAENMIIIYTSDRSRKY